MNGTERVFYNDAIGVSSARLQCNRASLDPIRNKIVNGSSFTYTISSDR